MLDLLPMLSAPTVYLVLGTLTERDDQAWLYRQIVAFGSLITDELLASAADALVLSWCGVPRWFARRVWEEILGSWALFEGGLSGRGVDVSALPAARATRLAWSTLHTWHGNDRDKGQSWQRRIEAEPVAPVALVRSARTASTDADSFLSVFAAVGGRAR